MLQKITTENLIRYAQGDEDAAMLCFTYKANSCRGCPLKEGYTGTLKKSAKEMPCRRTSGVYNESGVIKVCKKILKYKLEK